MTSRVKALDEDALQEHELERGPRATRPCLQCDR